MTGSEGAPGVQRWQEHEDATLRQMCAAMASDARIAAHLGRSVASVKARLIRLRAQGVGAAQRGLVPPPNPASWSAAEDAVLAQAVPRGDAWADIVAALRAVPGVTVVRTVAAIKVRSVARGLRRPLARGGKPVAVAPVAPVAPVVVAVVVPPVPKPVPVVRAVAPVVRAPAFVPQRVVMPVAVVRLEPTMGPAAQRAAVAAHLDALPRAGWPWDADHALAVEVFGGARLAAVAARFALPEAVVRARWQALVAVFDGMAVHGLPVEAAGLLVPALQARVQAVAA